MHVIHYNLTTTTQEGGVESFVWGLAGEQARAGHRVTLVSGRGPLSRDVPGVEVRMAPYVDRKRFSVGPLRRAYALRKLAERLTMLPRGLSLVGDADLVHIHKPYDLPLAPLLARRGIPLVYHGHGEGFFPGDRYLARRAAALLSCSTYNAATLREHYGLEATIVFNGVDTDLFRPSPPGGSELRERLLGGARALVLMPGRIMPWKGHHHVLEALATLGDPGVRLVIAGDGECRGALEGQAARLGIADRVAFTGAVPHAEMPRLLAAADLVVGASFASETFGMVLAEAMACERPVLASTWPGYDDVVVQGVTGERFPAADPGALGAALARLLADPGRLKSYAEAGRRRVLEMFTWREVGRRVQDAYGAAVERWRAGRR